MGNLGVPKFSNLKGHCTSSFHIRALEYHLQGGFMSRIDARGKLAQAVSDAPGRDISGAPTCDQLGRLLQALRAGVGGRQFAAQEQERRETSDVHWQGQALSHDFFSSAVHVIAEWLRRKWRAAWRVGTSACLPYDGQRHYEDFALLLVRRMAWRSREGP